MTKTKRIASLIGATLLFSLPACSSQRLDEATNLNPAPETQEVQETAEKDESSTTTLRWVGTNFDENERYVLEFLQARGITDRAALATILGNIKQESKFTPEICEGGAITGYQHCYTGGFGLIQWTTPSRYDGLGRFAKRNGLDPNLLSTQVQYMVTERQWIDNEYVWKTPGKSIDYYMGGAYRWLGWGIHGERTSYAHAYYNALSQV